MNSFYNMDEVTFEIRYEKDGKRYKWTGNSLAEFKVEAEYDDMYVEYVSYPVKTSSRTTITLENVRDLRGKVVEETQNINLPDLPKPPFGYYWEIRPNFDKLATRHYIGRPAYLEPLSEEMSYKEVMVEGKWNLCLVGEEGLNLEINLRSTVIYSLDDTAIYNAARELLTKHTVEGRAKTLRKGAARLIGPNQ